MSEPDKRPYLFRPITFRSVTVRNRIMVSPLCQFSAVDGLANDWHLVFLGSRAAGGAGIVCTEVISGEARGRISPFCVGLWNDEQRDALAPIADFIAAQGAVPAIQVGHAGRKASVNAGWKGMGPVSVEDGGWPVIGPSAVRFAADFPVPAEMDQNDIDQAIAASADAARRARQAGFKIIEVHGAHGYLIHQFLSPLSNRRGDGYGGELNNRARYLMETLDAVRTEWPDELPVFVRLSCTDWVEGGWDLDDTVELARMLKARGDVDLVDCSSGGSDPAQKIKIYPGYQVPFAERVKREAGIATGAVGLIKTPDLAEEILAAGRADLVLLGRGMLGDAHWPHRAAHALGHDIEWPGQLGRGIVVFEGGGRFERRQQESWPAHIK
ncbi:MAG: NADH:flavin oxidoreductase/NADH oxidase [Rhodospirillales bacterium]|nr:NADH:flavin oxidoreductase/NADH oxidase [Rhodospirillales bacterium]MDP6645010.1 NADH:flavin oxidoreductase/NADH oxidase [Rhodospirillales bacterium]